MDFEAGSRIPLFVGPFAARRAAAMLAVAVLATAGAAGAVRAQAAAHAAHEQPGDTAAARHGNVADARVGLSPGMTDAGTAALHMEHLANRPRPDGFFNPAAPGDMSFANSDLAFRGDYVFVGNFAGFQIYDVSDPSNPVLRTAVRCPGGQGDVSVLGDLLFMSVEATSGRVDCGPGGVAGPVSPDRFRGVRIFDISSIDSPRQVAAVQTCRGSHTHTLVPDPDDAGHVYVYVSGAAGVRPDEELPGCSRLGPDEDPETALFRIEVIRVPLHAPQDARVVSQPRVFADDAGNIAGLWRGGDHGAGTQRTAQTNHCHDITAYPDIGLAAGACSGNGILLDISDPVNPRRIDEVIDTNFAYWHSATFSNDGSRIIFTDEWGGGGAPRCRATDLPEWGANAIFEVADGRMQHAGYYKLPAPQTATENCVAHNGSLVPVPGRDIKVQAWYQGGISVFDFTDPAKPVEIAYFDRGPISDTNLLVGGFWSAYWHNGYIYGSEMLRGLDVLQLEPGEHLTENELAAAKLVRLDTFNPQTQPRFEWPPHFTVARAYVDQLERSRGAQANVIARIRDGLDRAEALPAGAGRAAALSDLATMIDGVDAPDSLQRQRLAASIRELAEVGAR
jgi:hypothetical protein